MRINKKLMTLYPTAEIILKQKEKYSTWTEMARNIGVSQYSLEEHRRKLRMKKEGNCPKNNTSLLTDDEIMENIRIMIGGESKNIYNKYKIVDEELFYKDQTSYDGLRFVGTFQGANWKSHHMPSAIHRNST
jgi:hypothetical protein